MWAQTRGVLLDQSDSAERISKFLDWNRGMCFVAIDADGGLLGTILCGHDTRRGYIYHLSVRQSARRSGIGTELVRRSLAALAVQDIHKCHIHVLADNRFAETFWGSTGWSLRNDILTYSAVTY
jgi:ribosomal protein S18 acetylase RimI-like enzyme